MKPLQTQSV